MKKVDGYYLYQVGAALQRLHELKGNFTADDTRGTESQTAFFALKAVKPILDGFLKHESYRLKTSLQKGRELITAMDKLITKLDNDAEKNKLLDFGEIWPVHTALEAFEAVLSSELALLDLYVITKKGNYDTSGLLVDGEDCFPKDLKIKVPECLEDIKAGAKCIAVSLPTAAGFHLLRANEAVLRKYWDVVTDGKDRPESGNMGEYINQLETKELGNAHVVSALKDLKNLIRNELIHPGDHLESVEEAIALMNHIHTTIFHMLKAIPMPKAKEKPDYGGLGTALLMAGSAGVKRRSPLMDLAVEANDADDAEEKQTG